MGGWNKRNYLSKMLKVKNVNVITNKSLILDLEEYATEKVTLYWKVQLRLFKSYPKILLKLGFNKVS